MSRGRITSKKVVKRSLDKLSTFFITVNTNEVGYPEAKLMQATEYYTTHIRDYLKFRAPSRSIQSITFPEASISAGPKQGRVHLHMIVKIHHRTNLQIDCIKSRNVFKQKLGLSSLHFSCKFIKDPTFRLIKYVRNQEL